MAFVFEHQGMAVGLRELPVQAPPAVQVPLAVDAPIDALPVEPASRGRRGWLWGTIVFVAAGAAAAAASAWPPAEPVAFDVEELAVPSRPPVEPEQVAEVPTPPAIPAISTVEQGPPAVPPPTSPAQVSVPLEQPKPQKTRSRRSQHRGGPTPALAVVPATSEVTLTRCSATGSLTSAAVRDAVKPLQSQLSRCHDELLKEGRDIKGRLTAHLDIRGRSVESIDLRTPIDSIALRACFRKVLLTAAFPATDENDYAQATVEFFLLARPPSKR